MKKMIPIIWVLLGACATKEELTMCDLLITHANVIDVQSDQVTSNQWVAISGDSIVEVGSMDAITYESKQTLDAAQKYLMPGLWDNHVHFRGGDSLIGENKELLKHFISHGITTVRDAGGDITHAVKSWQAQISSGDLLGPQIFTSGPKLDGDRPAWAGSLKVTNEEEVVTAFDSLESIGVNYVKTYDGSLSAQQYYQTVEEAERRGLKITGHMPLSAKLMDAVDVGLDGTEHMYYLLKACSLKEDSLTALGRGYGIMGDLLATYSDSLSMQVFNRLADKDFYVTPTLYIGTILGGLATDDHSTDSLLQYIGPGIQKTYEGRVRTAKRNASSLSQNRGALGDKFRAMIKPLHASGTTILAGSDCGPYNSFVYPGVSLHGELAELVANGLTPAQALVCSFVNGPKFVDLSSDYGQVSTGRKADLILLDKDPLVDIAHLSTVSKVIKLGEIVLP